MLEAIPVPDEHSAPFSLFGNSLTVESAFCYLFKMISLSVSMLNLPTIGEITNISSGCSTSPCGFASGKASGLLKTPSLLL